MTDGETAETTAEEAFALVGNELRAGILRVLGETPHEGVSFSELRERVDSDVDSGQFNYHLQKLVGPFVEKTDDGYVLRPPGLALYRAIKAGAFSRSLTVEGFDADFDCYFCETPVEAAYDDGLFTMTCPGCEHLYARTALPPSAVEGDRSELLTRVDQYNRHQMGLSADGVCPVCANPMALEFLDSDAVAWVDGAERLDVFCHRFCGHCGREQYMTVGLALLHHPAIVAFFHEHAVDVTAIPHWGLEFVMTDNYLTVRSKDPWKFELAVPCEGETLTLVVDDELNVIEEERS